MFDVALQILLSLAQLELGRSTNPQGGVCIKSAPLDVVCDLGNGTIIDLNHDGERTWLRSSGRLILICEERNGRAINCREPEVGQ